MLPTIPPTSPSNARTIGCLSTNSPRPATTPSLKARSSRYAGSWSQLRARATGCSVSVTSPRRRLARTASATPSAVISSGRWGDLDTKRFEALANGGAQQRAEVTERPGLFAHDVFRRPARARDHVDRPRVLERRRHQQVFAERRE